MALISGSGVMIPVMTIRATNDQTLVERTQFLQLDRNATFLKTVKLKKSKPSTLELWDEIF